MGKSVFLGKKDASGSNQLASVEAHAISYYVNELGYLNGIHGEGSSVVTIFGLLFWDVIYYDELPDAFHTKYQGFPLDLHFDEFYLRRKNLIEDKLHLIYNVLSMEDLLGMAEDVWNNNQKRLSVVSWSLFEDKLELLKGLMRAMGKSVIGKICERLAGNFRFSQSGFPDVVVWDDRKGKEKVLFAEVKGPGDTLSAKQQLWLDFLVENGIPAEVCHVKGEKLFNF